MPSRSPQLELSDMNVTKKYCVINAVMDIVTNCYKKQEKNNLGFMYNIQEREEWA